QEPRAALPAVLAFGIPPAGDGVHALFSADDLANVHALAEELLAPKDPLRLALRRRLRRAAIAGLDAGTVDEALLDALSDNLRALLETWRPRADLLDSGADDADFVAEVDDDGFAHLRFGDGDAGRAIDAGMSFLVTYRTGNGRTGLVGPETIVHAVFRRHFNNGIVAVRNPLPSSGAVDPESVADVKVLAPTAYRRQFERAVTAEDYAMLAQYLRFPRRDPRVQSAAGDLRWTGSWYEAGVAVDPFGTSELDPALQSSVSGSLHRVRRMGHALRIGAAAAVPLRVELDLCVKPEYLRAHVVDAVRKALGSAVLRDGSRGFFHPDNLTFGEAVYVSRIVAATMAVDGVAEVEVVRLERLDDDKRPNANPDLAKGLLKLGPNEIARVDNDPAAPENGILELRRVRGGR
ncbi:MAG TPA: putative baseplate assembly protein, partial [Thermoanaerobaculia bacterium]|nr:putative baseplate assembly protein [Thermoanaerobaculia bacterium]